MELRNNKGKIGRFYDNLKRFIEGDTFKYKVLFISLSVVLIICFALGFLYLKYGGMDNMFDYPEEKYEMIKDVAEKIELSTPNYFLKFLLERIGELVIVLFCFSVLSPFMTSLVIGTFQFIVFLVKKFENITYHHINKGHLL